MRFFRRKELRDIWGKESQMLGKYDLIWESSPVLRRYYRNLWTNGLADLHEKPIVELGAGTGWIRHMNSEVISADILVSPHIDMVCDGSVLPFASNSVGSFLCVAFYHHCIARRRFFEEVSRTLKPGGRIAILDPYISPLSRIIYSIATQESLDLGESLFDEKAATPQNPLLEANVARATIAFQNRVDEFSRQFPQLKIVKREIFNFFAHIAAGSANQKSPFPDWVYPIACAVDKVLHPVRRLTAMGMQVVLEKA